MDWIEVDLAIFFRAHLKPRDFVILRLRSQGSFLYYAAINNSNF